MITSSGCLCDICGKYILFLTEDDFAHEFTIKQVPDRTLHCDNACKEILQGCGGDWEKLPDGPLRKAFEAAAAQMAKT